MYFRCPHRFPKEKGGMSDDVKKLCDEFFYIPMNEKCESLNAGVSASILMYTQL